MDEFDKEYERLRAEIRPYLTEKRYIHTLGCCEMALSLAYRWGENRQSAMRAAMLHDITKKLTDVEQLKLCEKYGIINKYNKNEFGTLIHADTAAAVAKDIFGMPDDVVRAIALHTLGDEDMTRLDKIIYLSDAIEKGRDYPGVSDIREMAFRDLDRAVQMSLESTLLNITDKGGEPNVQSVRALSAIKKSSKTKENYMNMKQLEPKELLDEIIKTADSKKARDVVAIHVTEQTTLADYLVIMTGTSTTHIRALSDEIEQKLKNDFGIYSHHIEGITSNWILMDYTTVVVNIFMSEARELYALERMWGDSHKVDISKLVSE
ncbi:MAG: bis(5'-nucleosyl)-tetraphosphatase (symmetrical) YqeK [Clostridiaceae bacterium]|nr:bis(5'-nucleosyl)-tetraphosphatase (symmetrical) YqeK [Clostridiaceae bacterium]